MMPPAFASADYASADYAGVILLLAALLLRWP